MNDCDTHCLSSKDLVLIAQTCLFVILFLLVWWYILIDDSLNLADPSLYLPALVRLVYSPDENQSSASDAIIGVLKGHNQNIEIIFLLVDCLKYVFFSSLLFLMGV